MRYILVLLLGVIIGAAAVYFSLVGAPAARPLPGQPVAAPDANNPAPGTAIVTLDSVFFNTLLDSIFTDLGDPAFPLAANSDACANKLTVLRRSGDVQTAVRFADGRITAPLAFQGAYNVPLVGCQNFRGWAQTNIALFYNAGDQTLSGQLNVEGVNLEGLNPFVGNAVTPLVQNSINERVNPLRILNGKQLNLAVPVLATGGTLKAQVTDVRAEIQDALRLHVTYDFEGQK